MQRLLNPTTHAGLQLVLVGIGAFACGCGEAPLASDAGPLASDAAPPAQDAAPPAQDAAPPAQDAAPIDLSELDMSDWRPTDGVTCNATRPTDDYVIPEGLTGPCVRDADCGAGAEGRCIRGLGFTCCTYQECVSDADCGAGAVCACGVGPLEQNRCVEAGCRQDADCPGGRCALSRNIGYSDGFDGYIYECVYPTDECVPNQPCEGGGVGGVCNWGDYGVDPEGRPRETLGWLCVGLAADGDAFCY